MLTLRQTAIGQYEQCPWLFYYMWKPYGEAERYADNEMPTNKYASTGVALHNTMEIWGLQKKMGNSMTLLQLHDLLDLKFNEIPVDLFDDEEDKTEFYNSLHEQIDWLWEKACQNIPQLLEHKFEIADLIPGLPMFKGTIDRVDGDMARNHVHLIDYKSGKPYTKRELASNVQATIYALYWYKKYGYYPKTFTFLFSKVKKEKTIEITPQFIDAGVERIKSVWYHIVNNDFDPKSNKNTFFCKNFCDAKSECPKWKLPRGWEGVTPFNDIP